MMVLADELRQSVYQAAMQGKLSERLSEDIGIEQCISLMEQEQEKLVESGYINRRNSIKAIKDVNVPFEIPNSWAWIKLGDLAWALSDGIHGTPEYNDSGDYYFINGNNLENGKIEIKSDTKVISRNEYKKYWKPLTSNTVLLSINGTIGKIAFYDNEPVILGKSACYINLFSCVNKEFIAMLLKTQFFLLYGADKATQTTIKNLSLKAMRQFPVPLPPIEEQQRIVDRVDELMEQIDEYAKIEQQLISLKDSFPGDLRSAVLQAAMQGKLTEQLDTDSSVDELVNNINETRKNLINDKVYKEDKKLRPLSDDEIPFDIPENWRWIKLGYCSTYGQSKEKATEEDIKSEKWSLDLEDIEKITGRVLQKLSANKRQINGDKICFSKGDILYSKLRPYLLKILIADDDGICTPELIPFSMIGQINPRYVLWVLRSPHIDYTINAVTYGVKMPRVGTDTMLNLLIPLPPIEEQQRIVERLEDLLPLCENVMGE